MENKINYEAIIFSHMGESDGWTTRYSYPQCEKMMKKAVDIAERVDAYVADLSKNPHFAKLYTRYFENDKFDYIYEEN